jgi:hypothetical protein
MNRYMRLNSNPVTIVNFSVQRRDKNVEKGSELEESCG